MSCNKYSQKCVCVQSAWSFRQAVRGWVLVLASLALGTALCDGLLLLFAPQTALGVDGPARAGPRASRSVPGSLGVTWSLVGIL